MNEKRKSILILFTVSIVLFLIFKNNSLIIQNITNTFYLWLNKVLPSLFPMMIISDILIYNNVPELLNQYLGNIVQKVFKISPYFTFIFIISIFAGCPTNAIIIKKFLQENKISLDEATKILGCTVFQSPLFLYNLLSITYPRSTTIKIIIINYLINFLLIFIINTNHKESHFISSPKSKFNLSNSINQSFNTLTMILGTMIIFNMFKFNLDNPTINTFLNSLLEISNGLNNLKNIDNNILRTILLSFLLSTGGLCIEFQIKSIISDTSINYTRFLKYRLIQCISFSLIICKFIINY